MSKIMKRMDEIMDDNEKKININKVKWKYYDEMTKYSIDSAKKDDICYYIDDDLYKEMKEYFNLIKQNKNYTPLQYPIETSLYKIFIVTDGTKASYHYTKESVLRALKNSLYGYLRRQRNNRLTYFTSPNSLRTNPKKLFFICIGYVFGGITDEVKKYVYKKYVRENKCNYKLIKSMRELKRESKSIMSNDTYRSKNKYRSKRKSRSKNKC